MEIRESRGRNRVEVSRNLLPFVKSRFRKVFLLDSPFPDFDGSNNWLSQGLRVFLLNHSFDIFAIHVGSRRIILLVLVKNHRSGTRPV